MCTTRNCRSLSSRVGTRCTICKNKRSTSDPPDFFSELGHPQAPTPIHTNNTTTEGIVNSTIERQRSRSNKMRYFWHLDQASQRYFKFYYHPGAELMADYPTKAHTGPVHTHARPYYIHMENSQTELVRAAPPSAR